MTNRLGLQWLIFSVFVESNREKLFTAWQSPQPAGSSGSRNHTDQIVMHVLSLVADWHLMRRV
jgi:hypothetical protein